jgi:EAL domain-containing protein (putative c-di-GMP-specific phosphodiesterase class I)
MSVNLSAEQFQQAGLLQIVRSALDEAGIAPSSLELELTESCVMRDAERSIRVLSELADLGVCISVDDFGTGYSSLSYLRRLPLQRLKIDRSFICDIESNSEDAEITRAIVSMAHSLKLQVTAEGVETRAQHDFLRKLGCEQYQGFYCNPPLPADRFLQTLNAGEQTPVSATQKLKALGRIARNRLLPGGVLPET